MFHLTFFAICMKLSLNLTINAIKKFLNQENKKYSHLMACFIILNFRKTIYKSKLKYDCTTNVVEHYQKCSPSFNPIFKVSNNEYIMIENKLYWNVKTCIIINCVHSTSLPITLHQFLNHCVITLYSIFVSFWKVIRIIR